ncbi:hypothetical protein PIROE2DRAFT_61072 [Piromyces sp. E2]|nr:hypothetical protein PIROE2DRAFT_61072 [Piromyces sp. E2]|eukprot:OUM63805.1 hypothetical protein PIROE2DRAFT_61072 [Piromyces sp. E2]
MYCIISNLDGVHPYWLLLDTNGLISDKLHELQNDENLIDRYDENKMANIIFEKIEIMINIIKPRKFVGIYIDGVSPKAKMNLQRQRRVREYSKYSDKCKFNFNNTSAGTAFMAKLSKIIQEKIKEKKNSNSLFKRIDVVFSGPDVAENNYLPGIHDVLFNDIIEVYKENYKDIGFINNDGKKLNEKNLKKYLLLLKEKVVPINKIIYYLDDKMKRDDPSINNDTIKPDSDDDYNYIIKFELIDRYILKRDIFGIIQCLCNDSNLNSKDTNYRDPIAIKFLKFLCNEFTLEYIPGKKQIKIIDIDNKRGTDEKYWDFKIFCNKNNLDIHNLKDLSDKKRSDLISFCKENKIKFNEKTYSSISKKKGHEEDPFNIMNDILLKIKKDDQNRLFLNKKEEYYRKNLPNCDKKEFIDQFIEGIKWLLGSFYDKVPSWTWHFKHRCWINKCNSYGPFISDLCEFDENEDFKFDEDEPLSPYVQLMTILPSESSNLLPDSYKEFVNSEELRELYPKIDSFPDKNSMFKSFSSLPLLDSINYKEKIKGQKPSSENYCYRANIYIKMHRYKDAMNDCKNAIKDKKCINANLFYSRCYKHRGNLDKAKEHIKIGLEKAKGNDYLSCYIPSLENELNKIIEIENLIEDVKNLKEERNYVEALQKLETAMLKCDSDLTSSFSSNNGISKLKSEELKGIPIQWRLLRAELLIINNDYNEALNIAEMILKSPGNSKNSEANTLKTKLLYIMGKSNVENAVYYLRKAVRSYDKNEYAKTLIEKIPEMEERKKTINDDYFKDGLYEEAIQKYDDLIIECKEIYLTGTVLVVLLRNKCTCLIKVNQNLLENMGIVNNKNFSLNFIEKDQKAL